MNEFKIALLDFLCNNPSQTISIKHLTDLYCGEQTHFSLDEQDERINCRKELNNVLRDLQKMGWITFSPIGGLNTGTGYDEFTKKRCFIINEPVLARITTKGEIEYKQWKKVDEPIAHVFNLNNISGKVAIATDNSKQDISISDKSDRTSEIQKVTLKKFVTATIKWIADNIVKILVALVATYIAYKLGWKK